MPTKTKPKPDVHARVKARLIEALKAADADCYIETNSLGTNIDGWFDLDKVVAAVVDEVRR